MASVFEKYHGGKFRGVSFLVPDESKTGGKKTVTHEYPNSDNRYTEELGKFPAIFTMTCIIHGDDLINKRLQFEQALEQEGFGTLIHPIYGKLEVKLAGTYTVNSSQRNGGEFTFRVTFETSEINITASPEKIDKNTISENTDAVTDALDNNLEEIYKDPSFADSLIAMADKINDITEEVNGLVKTVITPIQENVSAFNSIVTAIEDGAYTIISSGETLKQTVQDLYDGFINIVELPEELLLAWDSLTDFSLTDPESNTSLTDPVLKSNTSQRIEIADNSNAMDSHTQITGLARYYEAAAYKTYTTDLQIDSIRQTLDDKYKSIILIDDNIINADIRSKFSLLRTNFNNLLNQKEQNVWRVRSITTTKTSLPLVAFRYYGNLDNLELLSNLNPDLNSAFIKDEMSVLAK